MKKVIDIFGELSRRFKSGIPGHIIERAIEQNSWFTADQIAYAAQAIDTQMLQRDTLRQWREGYSATVKPKRVMVVMAGNIPMVGFFDLLCVLMAGDELYLKPSHKDRVLMEWVVRELKDIEPSIPIYIIEQEIEDIDLVIATGSDATALYFEERYANKGIPTLLRGTRHSIAILTTSTTDQELEALADDIYMYSGSGCRNVSMLFIPKGFDLGRIASSQVSTHPKYRNNYLQNKALHQLTQRQFIDTGISCLTFSTQFPTRLSSISLFEYEMMEQPLEWIQAHDSQLQCIVATAIDHPRRVSFGEAQRPTLYDYADGIDTMEFLLSN